MPLFRFVIQDGSKGSSVEAIEYPNLKAAKDQAVLLAGAMLRELDGDFWNDSHWRLEVTDELGLLLCTIEVDGAQSPAAR